jgi:hypothetical protein
LPSGMQFFLVCFFWVRCSLRRGEKQGAACIGVHWLCFIIGMPSDQDQQQGQYTTAHVQCKTCFICKVTKACLNPLAAN